MPYCVGGESEIYSSFWKVKVNFGVNVDLITVVFHTQIILFLEPV